MPDDSNSRSADAAGHAEQLRGGSARFRRIKAVTRRLIERAGAAEIAAQATRVAHSQLSAYGALTDSTRFVPVDVVADLEADVGDPIVTRELATLAGFTMVPLAEAARGDAPSLGPKDITTIAARMGRLAATIDAAAEDGHLDLRELAKLTLAHAMIMRDRVGADAGDLDALDFDVDTLTRAAEDLARLTRAGSAGR